MVCKEDLDVLDPYRLPPREPDYINLLFVRPDVPLTIPNDIIAVIPVFFFDSILTEDGDPILTEGGDYLIVETAPPVEDVVFTIPSSSFNSNGPFLGSAYGSGYGKVAATPSGNSSGSISPNPTSIDGQTLVVASFVVLAGVRYWMICLAGNVPQDHFISVEFNDGAGNDYLLTTASANFNGTFNDAAFSTWVWTPVVTAFPPLNQPITIHVG